MSKTTYSPHILVIDDDKRFCETICSLVSRMNYICHEAYSIYDGLKILQANNIDLVFLDVHLPDGNGINYIEEIKHFPSEPEVIMLTGQGDPDGAEIAIQKGVWSYLVKPSSARETQISLQKALTYRKGKKKEATSSLIIDHIIGKSPILQKCFDTVAQAAKSDTNVLITGQTGTGKELFARTIHDNSHRAKENFIIVDCASLTKTLIESILFGHKKGAFTGADTNRTGLVKLADNGTLFLDEVGELPLSIQKTFLRVLQEKRFRPVGDTTEVTSDFRLIAATNRSLEKMISEKKFRQDLLFRLCTVTLHLPKLKDRIEDITPLTIYYIKKLCKKYTMPNKKVDPDFYEILTKYDWPGNVRQLFNVLERAVIASGRNEIIYTMDIPQDIRIEVTRSTVEKSLTGIQDEPRNHFDDFDSQMPLASEFMPRSVFKTNEPGLKEFKTSMEKKYLEEIIKYTNHNIKKILSISGLSRSHFYALLKKNKIPTKVLDNDKKDDSATDI